ADLDVQWAGAVAPGATVDFVSCASTSTSFGTDLSAIYIVNSLLATSMSESYGGCEVEEGSAAAAFYTEMWEQAAAQGQTVFVSSGDQGSLVCDRTEYGTHPISVNVVASTIYDVSTGGTDFSDVYQTDGFNIEPASTWWNTAASTSANGYESALSYVPEVTWGGICSNPLFASILEENGVTTWGTTYTPEAICNYSYNNTCGTGSTECAVDVSGGSGGISIFNSIPTWQAVYGVGLSANHSSTTARNQPDVSLYASEGDVWGHALLVCESDMYSCDFSGNSGAFAAGGGTSFVAPQMNGVMALIIQNSGAPQGNANYTFYDLAAQEYGTPGNPNTSGLSACSGSGLGAGVGGGCIFQDIAGDTPSLQGGTITSDIQQPCESGSSANCYTATAGDFLGETSLSSSTFIDAYPSSQGYDLGTGLGSLNISNLVGEWNTASTGFGSTTTVSADPPSITTSGTTTLTASVATTGRGNIAPALGTVTFTDSSSGATLGTAALAVTCAGTPPAYTCSPTIATLSGVSASSLVFGSNTIVASFPGDGANDLPSSGSVTVTVTLPPATTTVTSSQNPSTQGQSVTFTATVTASGSPAPTGTVSFTSNGAAISGCSSVTLASGTALCTTTPAIGTDAIVAAYSGDSNYSGSNGTFSQLVNPLPTPVQFFSVTPCRVVDTRKADGPFGGPELTAGETRAFTIPAGPCTGIPATAAAYSLNVTVVPPGPLGYLSIWPSGEGQPVVSTLNSLDGRVKANAAIVPAGSSGAVSVYVNNTTNVVLDIDGYFAAGGGSSLEFYPLTPCRVADTRKTPDGPLAGPALVADAERDFPILSSACSIPSTALAYSLNFTVVPLATGAAVGYLTVWPQGQTKPLVSTLNDLTGTIVANAALVPAGTDGGVAAYASNATNLVIDVNGYFAPAGTGGLQLYALTPCRVLDTRKTTGNFTGELTVNVAGSTCAPSSADKAYVFNATAVPAGDLGYLTLWPDGETQPVVSTLNAEDGAITSNMAIVPNTDGSTDAYASGTTQLILDISAYFAP
ncbi:MAG: Ig-like domain repeat protein, partial [Terriglobales bacterium]